MTQPKIVSETRQFSEENLRECLCLRVTDGEGKTLVTVTLTEHAVALLPQALREKIKKHGTDMYGALMVLPEILDLMRRGVPRAPQTWGELLRHHTVKLIVAAVLTAFAAATAYFKQPEIAEFLHGVLQRF